MLSTLPTGFVQDKARENQILSFASLNDFLIASKISKAPKNPEAIIDQTIFSIGLPPYLCSKKNKAAMKIGVAQLIRSCPLIFLSAARA
ncbi:hypothetical protein D9M72_639820 [compost metagenome]